MGGLHTDVRLDVEGSLPLEKETSLTMTGVQEPDSYAIFNSTPVFSKELFRNNLEYGNRESVLPPSCPLPPKRPTEELYSTIPKKIIRFTSLTIVVSLTPDPTHLVYSPSPTPSQIDDRCQQNSVPGGSQDQPPSFRHLVNKS